MDIYQRKGFENRYDYLRNLAEEYGIDYDTVVTLAHMLGPNEDFDGLVSTLNDFPVEG